MLFNLLLFFIIFLLFIYFCSQENLYKWTVLKRTHIFLITKSHFKNLKKFFHYYRTFCEINIETTEYKGAALNQRPKKMLIFKNVANVNVLQIG